LSLLLLLLLLLLLWLGFLEELELEENVLMDPGNSGKCRGGGSDRGGGSGG